MSVQQTERDLSATYFEVPESRTGSLSTFGWRRPGIWLGVSGFWTLCLFLSGLPLLGIIFFVITLFGAVPFEHFGYQYPGVWRRDYMRRRNNKRQGATLEEVGEERQSNWTTESEASVNLRVDDFLGLLGTVYDKDRKTDTAYFRVSSFRPALSDPLDRAQYMNRLSEAIKLAIAQVLNPLRYGFIVGSYPGEPAEWALDTRNRYQHPSLVEAYESMPEEHLNRSLAEWLAAIESGEPDAVDRAQMANIEWCWQMDAEDGATDNWLVFVTVPRPSAWKAFQKKPEEFTRANLEDSPLYGVFSTLMEQLENSGFSHVRLLTYEEVQRHVVFRAHNVLRDREAYALGQEPGFQPDHEWPDKPLVVSPKVVQAGSCYHAMWVARRFSDRGVRRILPNGMDELFFSHPTFTLVSTYCETFSLRRERWVARRRRDLRAFLFERRGHAEELEDRDKAMADNEAIDRLYVSRSKAIRMNVSFVVRASSQEELDDKIKAEEIRHRSLGIKTRRVSGRTTLHRAFWSATLGILP